jgi:hypothetical protein
LCSFHLILAGKEEIRKERIKTEIDKVLMKITKRKKSLKRKQTLGFLVK